MYSRWRNNLQVVSDEIIKYIYDTQHFALRINRVDIYQQLILIILLLLINYKINCRNFSILNSFPYALRQQIFNFFFIMLHHSEYHKITVRSYGNKAKIGQ